MTHVLIAITLIWNQPGHKELKMETVRTPETPRAPRTPAVRRNLLTEFDDADATMQRSPEVEFDLETPIQSEVGLEIAEQNDQNVGWEGFLKYWILVIVLCISVIMGIYQLIPKNLVIEFTREFQFIVIFIFLTALVISILWKMCYSRGHTTERTRQPVTSTARRRTRPIMTPSSDSTYLSPREQTGHVEMNIPLKRVFKGDGSSIWSEFIRYFENVANLNQWTQQRMRRILLTTLRDQAEAYAYGLPENTLQDYNSLKTALNQRFGHTALKESYIAEAKLRRKKENETFRDFGQAIEDLYRRAFPDNRDFVTESSLKTFLDNCSSNEDFRLAVKRTRPKTLSEAITAAMQEECIRFTENRKHKLYAPAVYEVKENRLNPENKLTSSMKSTKRCFKCNSTQHLMRDCPKNVRPNSGTGIRKSHVSSRSQQLNQDRPRQ